MSSPSLKISFLFHGVPCHGHSPIEKPLGGTESAMIFMAKALAQRGHRVEVFTHTNKPGLYDGVQYHSYSEFETAALKNPPDVLIGIRQMLPLLSRRWARLQYFMSPDAFDQPALHSSFNLNIQTQDQAFNVGLFSLKYVKNYIDGIICVGEWQAQTFRDKFQVPAEKIFVGYNGVDLDYFSQPSPVSQRKKQIVYASTPFRGLEELLRYFPEIKARVPDATCAIMSGMQTYGVSDAENEKEYGTIYKLAQQPGVTLYGPLAKKQMASILQESRVLAYPNTFVETFCIAALEAQAAGLPVVTTGLGGLNERVSNGMNGFLISGHPNLPGYQEQFIDKVVDCLTDDALWTQLSEAARNESLKFSYATLAATWENYFQEKLREPTHQPFFFLPDDAKFPLMINGYPKQIELKKEFLCRSYAKQLFDTGYRQTAEQVLKEADLLR